MTDINKIKEIIALRDSKTKSVPRPVRKERLIKLVARYGMDYVSAASGLRTSTIHQYTRANDPEINQEKLDIAREVLEEVFKTQ